MSEYDKIADRATRTPEWAADSTWIHMGNGVVATIIRVFPDAVTDGDLHAAAHKMAAAPDLLAALEQMQQANGCFDDCRWEYSGRHHAICLEATYAIAKARGSV